MGNIKKVKLHQLKQPVSSPTHSRRGIRRSKNALRTFPLDFVQSLSRRRINWENIFIYLFFIVFPFGQIIRLGIFHPLDFVVGMAALTSVLKKQPKPEAFYHFKNFLIIATFSWFYSISLFWRVEILYGVLYLLRLIAYLYFFVYVWNFSNKSNVNRIFLINSLLLISIMSGVFGWFQYYLFPTLKPFTEWGWDDHFLRLTGTFLDPTFLGLILVFGVILSLVRLMDKGNNKYIFPLVFLVVSVLFTYSRASYFALFAGLGVIGYYKKRFLKTLILICLFLVLVLALPTQKNNVLKFSRTFSAINRIENYKDTIKIFKTSPLFGVGYNNICLVRGKTLGYMNFSSHACSGSDSSILLILATTGVTGIIVFIYSFINVYRSISYNSYTLILNSSFITLIVHSLFSNSLFYPWIMGYMLILLALSPFAKHRVH